MAFKNAKLQQQYAEGAAKLAGTAAQDDELFRGVSIHVNGLTNPSHLVSCRHHGVSSFNADCIQTVVQAPEAAFLHNMIIACGEGRRSSSRLCCCTEVASRTITLEVLLLISSAAT